MTKFANNVGEKLGVRPAPRDGTLGRGARVLVVSPVGKLLEARVDRANGNGVYAAVEPGGKVHYCRWPDVYVRLTEPAPARAPDKPALTRAPDKPAPVPAPPVPRLSAWLRGYLESVGTPHAALDRELGWYKGRALQVGVGRYLVDADELDQLAVWLSDRQPPPLGADPDAVLARLREMSAADAAAGVKLRERRTDAAKREAALRARVAALEAELLAPAAPEPVPAASPTTIEAPASPEPPASPVEIEVNGVKVRVASVAEAAALLQALRK